MRNAVPLNALFDPFVAVTEIVQEPEAVDGGEVTVKVVEELRPALTPKAGAATVPVQPDGKLACKLKVDEPQTELSLLVTPTV